VQIKSLSAVDLSQLAVTVGNVPANLQVEAHVATSLTAGATQSLTYSLMALDASVQHVLLLLNLTTVEGVSLTVPLNVTIKPLAPHLTGPDQLRAGMVSGQQATWEFQITNDGGADTGPL